MTNTICTIIEMLAGTRKSDSSGEGDMEDGEHLPVSSRANVGKKSNGKEICCIHL